MTSEHDIWEGVQTCPAHADSADWDCTVCHEEMSAREKVLEAMAEETQTRLTGLSELGQAFPPQAIDHIRLETLIDMIVTERSAFLFEGEVGRRTILTLKAIQAEATRSTIMGAEKRLTVVKNGQRPT